MIDASSLHCIIKPENAHGTEFGELLYIRGIRRLAFASAFMSRSRSRIALSFVVACPAAGLRFRLGVAPLIHLISVISAADLIDRRRPRKVPG